MFFMRQDVDVRYLIAEGGFGHVYKAKRRGEKLAMKHVFLGSECEDNDDIEVESIRQQTTMEIQVLKQLKGHPNVVRLEMRERTFELWVHPPLVR